MSDSSPTSPTDPGPGDPDAVRADIDRTRAELADTVDQLADKLDVKSQASAKVGAAKDAVSASAAKAKASTPPSVQKGLDQAGEKMAPLAHQVSEKAAPHRAKIVAGVLAVIVVLVVVRRHRGRGRS